MRETITVVNIGQVLEHSFIIGDQQGCDSKTVTLSVNLGIRVSLVRLGLYLRLPSLRGHVCVSMGKFSRCIGHVALIVNLT